MPNPRWPLSWRLMLLSGLLLVAACGGGGGGGASEDPAAGEAGYLESANAINRVPLAEIQSAVQQSDSIANGLSPRYDVDNYRIEYLTRDAQGQPIVASGLVSVPVKAPGATSPVLSYQHGTTFVDAEAPSNHATADEAGVILASLGYIVLAPDYVGYGVSKGAPHPYLLADPTAAATVDLLTAARTWRRRSGVADNGQLFLTGYSEGGYATVAAYRALQRARSTHLKQLRAVVAGGGPYDLPATLDALLQRVHDEVPVLADLLDPGVLRFLSDADRRRLRDELMKRLRPDDADVLFDNTMIDRFLRDDTSALDELSSVHDWAPEGPLRLFHGRDDATVPFASSTATLAAMLVRGARDVTLSECSVVPATHIGCVPQFLLFTLTEFALFATDL